MATRNFVPRANNEGGIGTSVKQWASGFFQKLAVGAITTAVTVLTPSDDANNQQPATTGWVRSRFQSILKTVLTAAGLKYNIATNGYICFGSLFGGLILQWGVEENLTTKNGTFAYPIAVNNVFMISGSDRGGSPIPIGIFPYNASASFNISSSVGTSTMFYWFVIGH